MVMGGAARDAVNGVADQVIRPQTMSCITEGVENDTASLRAPDVSLLHHPQGWKRHRLTIAVTIYFLSATDSGP